ncbi:hypothetical protein CEUSTIGMA_g2427.t1 [Chlamydomonas eustigma]|uniref:protein-tyrosine sulfotransferase n=1 Tax=Chlamydomonas eustigma TaxID=1157962 RepID=A0A250WVY7_9CHLO|nr:hypothetical protein CEUSTIGMA_g2427.t1 [Chlamydomonas eustigma]|eukprot:GAX74981.1 hypothetical protein CEUSTIGMA_g2427.t1 [Chlamydomonas eustigma]
MSLLHILAIVLYVTTTCARELPEDVVSLESRLKSIRSQLRSDLSSYSPNELINMHLDRALTLQKLNHLKPDGGKRIAEAEEAYRSALSLVGDRFFAQRIRGNLGALFLEAGRAEEALAEFDHCLSMTKDPSIMFNRAKALGILGSVEEADVAYAEAAHASYGSDLTSFSKAVAAMEKLEDQLLVMAEEVLGMATEALKNSGSLPPRVAELAPKQHVEMEKKKSGGWLWGMMNVPQDAGRAIIPAWLTRPAVTDVSYLAFGVYKAKERRKEYAAAWKALAFGNALMRTQQQYNMELEESTLDTLLQAFTGPFGASDFNDETPIFVVGLPRSGSTLVEQILSTHSMAWGAGEDTALAPLTPDVNRVLATPGSNYAMELKKLGKKYVRTMRAMVPVSRDPPPIKIVDKMLRNIWLVGYIDMLIPKAKIVHVMRHPMDAGLSCFAQPFGYNGVSWAWDLHEIAAQIKMTHRLANHWDETHPGRVLTIFYEELVQYPREVATELLEWVGLPWEEGVLSFYKAERQVATASVAQVRKPLYNSSVARWRIYEQQLGRFQSELCGTIQAYEDKLGSALARRRSKPDAVDSSQQPDDSTSMTEDVNTNSMSKSEL